MKKPTLQEELQRIHEITYGKSIVNENFIDDFYCDSSHHINYVIENKKSPS